MGRQPSGWTIILTVKMDSSAVSSPPQSTSSWGDGCAGAQRASAGPESGQKERPLLMWALAQLREWHGPAVGCSVGQRGVEVGALEGVMPTPDRQAPVGPQERLKLQENNLVLEGQAYVQRSKCWEGHRPGRSEERGPWLQTKRE